MAGLQMGFISFAYWALPLAFFSYYTVDLLLIWVLMRKHSEHPLVGKLCAAIPRFLHNLIFAGKAAEVLEAGYNKFKFRPFQFIRGDGRVLVLPNLLLDELSTLPAATASPNGALEHDLLGPYTGLNLILESRLHHSIVQRKLTPRLEALIPALETEVRAAFDDYVPRCDDWTEFMPYQVFGKISARLSARALVGPTLCRDTTWLDISVNYTECLFRTVVILRLFPNWTHPILCRLLPSYWHGQRYVRAAKALLGPRIQELLCKNDAGTWNSEDDKDDWNVLSWLSETAKGRDRNPDTLAHVEVLLALASVHTTLLRMVNVLYDLTANPGYFEDLANELEAESQREQGWNDASYAQLSKLDSVLRESQRMSPPTTLGMKRLFLHAHMFSNGLYVPKGTYVCMPTFAIENDPAHTVNPEQFDGLRSYKRRQQNMTKENEVRSHHEEHQFTSAEHNVLNFGYGKSACPGRFFASIVIKILFVKLLSEYEFQFLPGTGRPKNLMVHEFLFCWPWQKLLVKRKHNASCPF